MAKFTPSTFTTLSNEASAVAKLNSNLSAIATALENTLSRDGTSPNSMAADLDMDSNRILNLPGPISDQEPIRLGDLATLSPGTVSVSTYGQTLVAASTAAAARTVLGLGSAALLSSSGLLQASNNLSDVASASTARTNLGLATVASSGSASDLSTGTLPSARLPTPGASTLGGVKSSSAGAGQFATGIDTNGAVTYGTPTTITGCPDIIIQDQKSSGTGGGASTNGSYLTRTLNTVVRNNGSYASLSSNQITLAAGTYWVEWSSPSLNTGLYKTRLQNVTDATTTVVGTATNPNSANSDVRSLGSGVFTIATSKTFELQYRCSVTQAATSALGAACSFGDTEVYSSIEFTKIA